jgi:hypothetical protein
MRQLVSRLRSRFLWGALLCVCLLFLGCQSTKIADVWVSKDPHPGTYQRILIVALAKTPGLRAQYENDFADKLANSHTLAVASINLIPDVKSIDRRTLEAWSVDYKLDAVVVTRVANVKRDTQYVPPVYTMGGWYGAWAIPASPGRVIENTTISLETDLFDAKSEKLIYSAVTKTFDPSSRTKAVHEVIDALVKDMTRRGYLRPT